METDHSSFFTLLSFLFFRDLAASEFEALLQAPMVKRCLSHAFGLVTTARRGIRLRPCAGLWRGAACNRFQG